MLTDGDVVLLWRMTRYHSCLVFWFGGFFSPTTSLAVDEWLSQSDCSETLKSLNFGLLGTIKKNVKGLI